MPYAAAWQTQLDQLIAAEKLKHAGVTHWLELPGEMRAWVFPDDALGSEQGRLTATCFERYVTPEWVGRFNEPGRP